jgi:hypothetical protein
MAGCNDKCKEDTGTKEEENGIKEKQIIMAKYRREMKTRKTFKLKLFLI